MKKGIGIIILCLSMVFCLPVSALSVEDVEINLPEEYICVTEDNVSENADALALLGYSESNFKSHIKGNGIILLGLMGNNTRQIQLRAEKAAKDSFAENIKDFSMLSDEALGESAKELIQLMQDTEVLECSVVANGQDIKAIKIVSQKDDVAAFQYVTVRNNKVYTLVGYDKAGSDGAFMNEVFGSLNIPKKGGGLTLDDGTRILSMAIVLVLIGAALFIIVRTIISLIYDFRNRENDVSDYIKIKRRKF